MYDYTKPIFLRVVKKLKGVDQLRRYIPDYSFIRIACAVVPPLGLKLGVNRAIFIQVRDDVDPLLGAVIDIVHNSCQEGMVNIEQYIARMEELFLVGAEHVRLLHSEGCTVRLSCATIHLCICTEV